MKKSHDKLVKEWLESGKAISTWKAIKMWRHTRLSRSINTLRNAGMKIYGIMAEHGGRRFKIYYTESNERFFKAYGKSY